VQEGIVELCIYRAIKCVLVKACIGSGVISMNKDPMIALLVGE
jgi:hypothetical protein